MINLVLQTASGQTDNLAEWRDAYNNVLGYLDTAARAKFAGLIAPYLRPAADSTTAVQLQTASGTAVLNVDTTNSRVGIATSSPSCKLEIQTPGALFRGSSAGLAHGITDVVPTNVFCEFSQRSTDHGSLIIRGLSDSTMGAENVLFIMGIHGAASPTAAAFALRGGKKSGTNYGALAANEPVLDIQNYTTTICRWLGSGDMLLGTTARATAGYGKLLIFGDNAAHPTLGSNTAAIYGYDSGTGTVELWGTDEAGNSTQLTPHDKETGEWILRSRNKYTGIERVFRIERLIRRLAAKFPELADIIEETVAPPEERARWESEKPMPPFIARALAEGAKQ